MLETGVLLLFLVPGLAAYCAVFGLFHNGKAIAPEPPPANSIQAVALIAGASIVIHALTATAFSLDLLICGRHCPVTVPGSWLNPYSSAFDAIDAKHIGVNALAIALGGLLAQGTVTYLLIRVWLTRLSKADRLPPWIYGWATDLANTLDNEDRAVTAYVLTTADIGTKAVAYGGLLNDVSLKADGCIARISLLFAERYLVDLQSDLETASLSKPLSRFTFMTIDAENIRNVAFEAIDLPPDDDPPAPDALAMGLRRIYRPETNAVAVA